MSAPTPLPQRSAGWLALFTLVICATVPAVAQGDLAITVSSGGFFATQAGPPPQGVYCSNYSPQFTNEIQSPANQWPFTSFHPAPTIPIGCINTKVIWVMNKGTVPTVSGAAVTVTDLLTPDQPKGSTILTANGYCAWENTGSTSGQIWCLGDSRNFGAPTNKISDNGWNCTVTQGKLVCTRSDTLAAGATYPPITVKFIREDFSPLICFNDLATVTGGGFTDIDPTNNVQFDDYASYVSLFDGFYVPVNGLDGRYNELVVVNSVPNGRSVRVDGSYYQTPHFFLWTPSSIHTIEGEDNPTLDPVCSAPIPGTGTAFPGNPGYTVVGYTNSLSTRAGTSGVGCQNPTSFTLPEFRVGLSPGFPFVQFLYEYITVRFKR